MSGHYSPETGRNMEDLFVSLIERIGYRVSRRGTGASGLDAVADFLGKPINLEGARSCRLLPPSFSPKNTTAFSLKKRDIRNSDIEELIEKVDQAKKSESLERNDPLRNVEGMVLVTNFTKTETEIEELLSKKVFLWDGRRLLFYSAKARAIQELLRKGDVEEFDVKGVSFSTYLRQIETHDWGILVNIVVFVDNHKKEFKVSADHIKSILVHIYQESLEPIVTSTTSLVRVKFIIHSLGLTDDDLVQNAYNEYAAKLDAHPKVLFDNQVIFQYDSAPWAILFLQ